MRMVLCGWGALIVLGLAISPFVSRNIPADDKPARPDSAMELGKTWRYPGTSPDAGNKDASDPRRPSEFSGPLDKKLKNLDRTTLHISKPKASFEDVWNFYAGKCGHKEKWKMNSFFMLIEQTDGKGQRMVIDHGSEETHFGLFTEKYVVHVQIRKVDIEYTEVRILTTLR